jgi:hypothetical protein
MRIARLELKAIGPFQDAVFALQEPNGSGEMVLFEGPNGSGKTTIVETIANLAACVGSAEDPKNERLRGAASPDYWRRLRTGGGAVVKAIFEHEGATLNAGLALGGWFSRSAGTAPVVTAVDQLISQFCGAVYEALPATWAAFAYRAHHRSASIASPGPNDIQQTPFHGALSFGSYQPAASEILGQLLTNLESERVRAVLYAQEASSSAEREKMAQAATSRRGSLERIERSLTLITGRAVAIHFPFDQHAAEITLDGEPIPLDLLGEGLRSTFGWLSDLLVRLERIRWADASRSPLEQSFWLLLDEVEESLHPTMQARLFPGLRQLFPNAHIYAATHSPFVVASVGEGTVFPIRPGKDHRVRGEVKPRPLQPGESLELVTTEIFQAPSGFVDAQTRHDIEAHDRDVQTLRRKRTIDWEAFLARRDRLMRLNEEVWTLVAMQEVPVREEVQRRLRERDEAKGQGVSA